METSPGLFDSRLLLLLLLLFGVPKFCSVHTINDHPGHFVIRPSPAALQSRMDADDVDLADGNTLELTENEENGYYRFEYSCRSFPQDMCTNSSRRDIYSADKVFITFSND